MFYVEVGIERVLGPKIQRPLSLTLSPDTATYFINALTLDVNNSSPPS
jgi:hypothetical protein